MRILLIEDEEKLSRSLCRDLKAEGFAIDAAPTGAAGLDFTAHYDYDIVVLDIGLPDMDGAQVLKEIRRRNREVPVLLLTARGAISEKVRHFEAGADDYLTKPFSFAELVVRLRALGRRQAQQESVIRAGDFELDRMTRQVRRGEKRIELSAKEYMLLEYFASNAGRILSRAMILEHVWDQSFEGLANIVDVYVRHLRAKIDDGHEKKLLRTVRGAGYVFGEEAP